jgi:hypothetical protein
MTSFLNDAFGVVVEPLLDPLGVESDDEQPAATRRRTSEKGRTAR